jgi:hypothetical protein
MKYISLVFDEDLHRDEVSQFKAVHGCIGVSSYKNTVNVYFKQLDRTSLLSLARTVQSQLVHTGTEVKLENSTLDSSASTVHIYEALKCEVQT